MALHDRIQQMRKELLAQGKQPVPDALQNVSKDRLRTVLSQIDRNAPDIVDAVFALLDNHQPSWFSNAPDDIRFCDGATTAHIACHVGILQRGVGKLDREGRDYWLKPLWEIGAMEKVYFDSSSGRIIPGHPVAKSPNCAYRLAPSFAKILLASKSEWEVLFSEWIKEDAIRARLELQAQLAETSRTKVETKHSDLIHSSIDIYVPRFLSGYEVVYVDVADGDRVTGEDCRKLTEAGLDILLGDAMPDVLLWNRTENRLWIIEAVTSDGEVDLHKVSQMQKMAQRAGKRDVGFTTAYPTWKVAANRQGQHKNIAPGTYIWIQEDPSKHFFVSAKAVELLDFTR